MDKPTLRTAHGTFTSPVRLDGDLVPRDLADRVRASTDGRRRNRVGHQVRSFALAAVARIEEIAPSRPLIRADEG